MRLQGMVWISVAAAVAACGSDPVRAPRGDGVLVLEVGGAQPSLRAALQAAGRSVEPPRWLSPKPTGESSIEVDQRHESPQPSVEPDPSLSPPEPQPDAPPPEPVQPALESEWVTVPLPEGQTLVHVARRHLGDGRRFVDLLEWNGWSDADARRLPKDTPVRIKRSELIQR